MTTSREPSVAHPLNFADLLRENGFLELTLHKVLAVEGELVRLSSANLLDEKPRWAETIMERDLVARFLGEVSVDQSFYVSSRPYDHTGPSGLSTRDVLSSPRLILDGEESGSV